MGNIINNKEISRLKKTLNKRNNYIQKILSENIKYKNEINDLDIQNKKYQKDLSILENEHVSLYRKYNNLQKKIDSLLIIDSKQDKLIKDLRNIN